MYRSGRLRTLAQTVTKNKLAPSLEVLSSRASTKNVTQNHDRPRNKLNGKHVLHTSRRHHNCNTPMNFEPWIDEDIICVLQGSCMPGSTRYCRTNSMFGKLDIADIMQGVPVIRKFSTLSGNPRFSPVVRGYHSFNDDRMQSSLLTQKSINPLFIFTNSAITNGLEHRPAFDPSTTSNCMANTSDVFGQLTQHRHFSTSAIRNTAEASKDAADAPKQLTQREKLKRAVKEYGGTVVVFHVCISLASLGGFYLAVSSGLDVAAMLKFVGFSEDVIAARLATNASTFVISYAVYKLFMPVRLGVTLTVAPLLVQYLRRINVLKPPVK